MIDEPLRPKVARLFKFRWIKEAVNALLPVAQVGGEFARARLLIRDGASLRGAAASCTVDAAAGVTGLFLYTLLGLAFFVVAPHDAAAAELAGRGSIAVDGRVSADIVQECVVSLEPVEQAIDEPVAVRFAPERGEDSGRSGEIEVDRGDHAVF